MAYLTNKCFGEGDLEYYIMEAGHIMGLRLPDNAGAKFVLSEVFKRVAQWKMVGSLGLADANGGGMDGGGFDQFEL